MQSEEARLRDEHGGLDIRRVILEEDLKREYQEFLQEHTCCNMARRCGFAARGDHRAGMA